MPEHGEKREEFYDFLLERHIDYGTLARAGFLASRWNVSTARVLVSLGLLNAEQYIKALSDKYGASFISPENACEISVIKRKQHPTYGLKIGVMLCLVNKRHCVVMNPLKLPPVFLKRLLYSSNRSQGNLVFASYASMRAAVLNNNSSYFLHQARRGLERYYPLETSRTGLTTSQKTIVATTLTGITLVALQSPIETFHYVGGALNIVFFTVILLRISAIATCGWWKKHEIPHTRQSDAKLPIYTILVPLLREGRVLPRLIMHLNALDYPKAKLDIKIILEQTDSETLAVAKELNLHNQGNVDIIIVPDCQPRTKPKALNYATQFAEGEYVVIYDAEDEPEPAQLRKALAKFAQAPPEVGCLQARLNYRNPDDNWLTGQATTEYCMLFDAMLPSFEKLKIPIPLGGTSNHFRADVLRRIGLWDAFNVTEDADLGLRLYRHGFTCQVLESTTYEEACWQFGNWLRQRTRWIKGWIQTYFVHMRNPRTLWQHLGARSFFAFQAIFGGHVLTVLAHPVFMVLLTTELVTGGAFSPGDSYLGVTFWALALSNLSFGYIVSILLGFITLRARKIPGAIRKVLFMPFYWFLMSIAGYRAIFQLISRPFYWEKTEHGVAYKNQA
jgi:cellulose synthase/poly-beta-1,6-N-acetylglucosamine synthase-like glycosyltransferase